eukprot:TRINITY_DN14532_c0_g1_i4.p1 TRINITY_DN14532_c0_g1~~TRINITY_DN14532_c0_g1_i4.p1  ORF type:complete len:192 (-),score=37.17 TRINITY_DN14532_c0_g1_i4:16-591(-)
MRQEEGKSTNSVPKVIPESTLLVEQCKNIGPRCADVFPLGCVLLYLLFGEEPWTEEDDVFFVQLLRRASEKRDIISALDVEQRAREESKENAKYSELVCEILKAFFKTNLESKGGSRHSLVQLESVMERAMNRCAISICAVQEEQNNQRCEEATLREEVIRQLSSNNVRIGNMQNLLDELVKDGSGLHSVN